MLLEFDRGKWNSARTNFIEFIGVKYIFTTCYLLIEQDNFDGDDNHSNEGDGDHGDKHSNVIVKLLKVTEN